MAITLSEIKNILLSWFQNYNKQIAGGIAAKISSNKFKVIFYACTMYMYLELYDEWSF